MNRIRREHEALQFNDSLRFHGTDNDALIAYSKVRSVDRTDGPGLDVVLTVVNLDHRYPQSGWVDLDLGRSVSAEHLPLRRARPPVRRPLRLARATNFVQPRPGRRALPRLRPQPAERSAVEGAPMTTHRGRPRAAGRPRRQRAVDRLDVVVQGRRHLRAPRAGLPRRQRRRRRRLQGTDREARLPAGPRRHGASGSCPSTRPRCATTATTSPTTARSIRPTARLRDFRLFLREAHRRGHARHHRARPGAHLRRSTRGSSGPAGPARARATGTSTSGATRRTATPRPGSSSRTSSRRTGPSTRWPAPTTGTASTRTNPA